MLEVSIRPYLTMEQDRQRLIEDRKALQDAIRTALAIPDDEEVKRLTKHLAWLENYLRKGENK